MILGLGFVFWYIFANVVVFSIVGIYVWWERHVRRTRDKVVFVKDKGSYWSVIGSKFYKPGVDEFSYDDRTIVKPDSCSVTTRWGMGLYFVDLDNEKVVGVGDDKIDANISSEMIDGLLHSGFVRQAVDTASGSKQYDYVLMGMCIGLGFFAGYMFTSVVL